MVTLKSVQSLCWVRSDFDRYTSVKPSEHCFFSPELPGFSDRYQFNQHKRWSSV